MLGNALWEWQSSIFTGILNPVALKYLILYELLTG